MWQAVDIDELTDDELNAFFKDADASTSKRWAIGLAKWIRDHVPALVLGAHLPGECVSVIAPSSSTENRCPKCGKKIEAETQQDERDGSELCWCHEF